jgi:hypothetical protein
MDSLDVRNLLVTVPLGPEVRFKCHESWERKNSVALVRKRTMPTERPPLVGEVVPTFADRGCCVVSATDPPVVSLGFLDRSRYCFFQVAPQLASRG